MKWRIKGVFLLTVTLAMFCFTACKDGGEPQIIGEKQESDASGQGDETNAPEGNTESNVREQVQAPERYQTELEEGGMILSADAPVTVPDVETAVSGTSRSINFTEDEYSRVKKALTDVMQIQWQEEKSEAMQRGIVEGAEEPQEPIGTNTSTPGVSASGIEYNISYVTYEEIAPFPVSLIWITRMDWNGGSSDQPNDYSETDEGMGQPAGRGAEMQGKAAELLRASGFEDYQLYRGRWRRSYYERGDFSSLVSYCMTFTPTARGIVCAAPQVSFLEDFHREVNGPYIDIVYREDGTLEQFRIIGKEDIQEGNTDETFLLPFEAVHQLFEQYCRDFFSAESINRRAMQDPLAREGYTTARARIKVENVKLEYIFAMPEDDTKKELELIPVWNFYGNIENAPPFTAAGDRASAVNVTPKDVSVGRILSIRADDGQILID